MSKPKVYIAGPMRGYDKCNFPAFDAAAERARAKGYHAISPAAIDRLLEGWGEAPPDDFTPSGLARFLRRDLNIILDMDPGTDFIYMLKGWEKSKGALAEKAVAEFMGMKVVYEDGGKR